MNSQKTQGQQEVARFASFGKIIFLFSFHPPTIRRPFADQPPTIRRPSADHPRAFDCN